MWEAEFRACIVDNALEKWGAIDMESGSRPREGGEGKPGAVLGRLNIRWARFGSTTNFIGAGKAWLKVMYLVPSDTGLNIFR